MVWIDSVAAKCRISSPLVRESIAEFLGTMVLILFGDASVAQYVFSMEIGDPTYDSWHSISMAWGFAVAMGVWVSGGVSGGHINPAVSGALWSIGRLDWKRFVCYSLAQYLGAFTGAACVYGVYWDALQEACNGTHSTDPDPCATAGIYATYPKPWFSTASAFGEQIMVPAFAMILILAILDERNMRPPKGMIPFCIGLIFALIGLSYGYNCGFPLNPARDLGPRIFTAIAGYGTDPFSHRDYNWFWVPWIAPYIGMVIGAWLYLLLIEFHWPPVEEVLDEPPRDYTEEADNKINRHPMKDMSNLGNNNEGFDRDSGQGSQASVFL